jgi:RimJ/RimL family protein N-acetyltransferase
VQIVELETPRLRLHLRPVRAEDLEVVAALGADLRVMDPLGGTMSRKATQVWLERLIVHWERHGYGRFLVSLDSAFVGVVGLSRADLDEGIVSGVEIAWRLEFAYWGHGYATEAAEASIRDGFERVGLQEIIGFTTPNNGRSRRIMDRLGMVFSPGETFEHPRVPEGDPRRRHVVYRLTVDRWRTFRPTRPL